MKMALAVVVALLLLVAVGGSVLATQQLGQGGGSIYTVNQVLTGLITHPKQWVGRTVRVRAVVAGAICAQGCFSLSGYLWEDLRDGQRLTILQSREPYPMNLLLSVEPRPSVLGALSRLPIIGPHIPGQQIAWQSEAVYRLRLQTRECPAPSPSCFAGILLNAVPSDPGSGW